MQRFASWKKHFNWRMLLMRTVVNALALLITALVVPKIYFVDRTVWSWFLVAVGLGVLNAVIKPLIQFATLRFIFATYGVVVVVINAILLFLLALLFPNRFAVDSILWALVGGAVIGIVSALLENLLGLTPPIVSEKYPAIRQRIKDIETHTIETHVAQAATEQMLKVEGSKPPAASPTDDAAAILAVVGADDEVAAAESQRKEQNGQQTALQQDQALPIDRPEPEQKEA